MTIKNKHIATFARGALVRRPVGVLTPEDAWRAARKQEAARAVAAKRKHQEVMAAWAAVFAEEEVSREHE